MVNYFRESFIWIKVLVSASLEDLPNFIQMFLIVSAGKKKKKKKGGVGRRYFSPLKKYQVELQRYFKLLSAQTTARCLYLQLHMKHISSQVISLIPPCWMPGLQHHHFFLLLNRGNKSIIQNTGETPIFCFLN